LNSTISLALIVRDSSATLDKCLSTFKEIAEEIVVVDTGSVDNTVEIARKYTDKVFFFKWIDDFSAARNFSLSKCTCDFIFWVDSDDHILPEDIQKVKNLDLSDKEIVICNYVYSHEPVCNVPRERIIRRSLGLRFEDEIHEYIPLTAKVYISDISTHHDKQQGSSERNLALLEKVVLKSRYELKEQIEKKQEKEYGYYCSSRSLYYLGKEFFEIFRYDQAIIYLEAFVKRNDAFWEDVYQAHYQLANCYLNKGDEKKFKEHIYESMKVEEQRAEPYYLLGQFYMNKQQWNKAIHWFELCTHVKRSKDLLAYYEPDYSGYLPFLNLTIAYNNIGDTKKARECNKKALEYRPKDERMLNNERIFSRIDKKDKDGAGKKLNLGSGNKPYLDYVNVDVFKAPNVNEVFNFVEIPYKDESISAIHSEHSLEHVSFAEVEQALKEWYRVLMPQGELHLMMPDFEDCCRMYLTTTDKRITVSGHGAKWWYKRTIYGIQTSLEGEPDEAQFHLSGFSCGEMQGLLEKTGFQIKDVKSYNGSDTPSFEILAIKPITSLKIGWICPPIWEAAQSRIRVLNVDRWLKSKGYQSELVDYNDILEKGFDIAIIGKGFTGESYNWVRILKQYGKKVYCDLCESVIEYPYVRETIALCDKVICCSRALAELYSTVNPNVIVIEDAWEN
jgi:predicted SAM-dependent methyltransferase